MLDKEEMQELEKAYTRNKSFIWKAALLLPLVEIVAQLINLIKGKPAFRDFDLLYLIFFMWCGIAGYLYFILLPAIKKDMTEQQKLRFRTRVIRKGKSNELDVKTWGLRIEKNNYGIKFVKVSEEAYLKIEPQQEIEISIAPRSKVYLSHREL